MDKLLTLTVTCYDTNMFDTCAQYLKKQGIIGLYYHNYDTIYQIDVVDNSRDLISKIWSVLESYGVELTLRNYKR